MTLVEAWRNSDKKWYRIKITLNSGVTREYNPTHGGIDTLHKFPIPPGKEFIGFYIYGGGDGCLIITLMVIVRSSTCDLNIYFSPEREVVDATQILSFTTNP